MKQIRRPSISQCADCGQTMHLVRCGVDAHMDRYQSKADRRISGCNGRVYIHADTGGMECE